MNRNTKYITITQEFLVLVRYMSPQTPSIWMSLVSYWYSKKKKEGEELAKINAWVKPSLNTLLNGSNVGREKLIECLDELEILGFIKEKKQQIVKGKKNHVSNLYYLDERPKFSFEKLDNLWEFQSHKQGLKNSKKRKSPNDFVDESIEDAENSLEYDD